MIQKLKLLKNTGKFYDFSAKGNGLDWHKNTFLFAPNAYGKSTLVNVFRSLRDNAPKIMRARKTVNASMTQEAIIIVDGVNHVFNGTKWDNPCQLLQIFDTNFINANILAQELQMNGEYGAIEREDGQQLAMVLAEKTGTYRTKSPSKARRDISRH